MTTTKLSPSKIRVLKLLTAYPQVRVAQHTSDDDITVHGPTVARLVSSGLVRTIYSGAHNVAVITDEGREALGEKPAKAVAKPEQDRARTVPEGGFHYRRGEVIKDPRAAGAAYAVAHSRRIRKGRAAGYLEVTLAPITKMAKDTTYATVIKVRSTERYQNWEAPTNPFTMEQVSAAITRFNEAEERVRQTKEACAESGREVMGEVDYKSASLNPWAPYGCENIHPGDVVTVRYRDSSPRKETVVKLNVNTGKVAIKAPSYKMGYRWIHAKSITKVAGPERELPVKLSDVRKKDLEGGIGWVQIKIGSEFIERSYVVAKTREEAGRKGTTYDTSDSKVYLDPASGYFWRDTGCFD